MHQYAAGLIDGEGYIGIQEAGGSFQVRLKVAMSDKGRSALEQMVRLYGGRINDSKARNERYRDTCTWVVTGEHACSVIRKVKKWLIVKQEPAGIALSFQVMLEIAERRPNGRRAWTDEMRAKAAELRARIQEANRRGPDPEVNPRISNMTPIAKYRAGAWWDANDSLFGPEPFSSGLPASGAMIDGVIYEAQPGIPSSSPSDEALLRTPCAAEVEGGALSPARAKAENRTLRLSGQMIDLVAPGQLLPTPQARDWKGRNGGAIKGWGKDLNWIAEEITLLPTPVAQPSGNTPQEHLRKKPGREVVTDLAILVENEMLSTGGRMSQQSDEPSKSWDDVPLPLQS